MWDNGIRGQAKYNLKLMINYGNIIVDPSYTMSKRNNYFIMSPIEDGYNKVLT